MGLSGPLWGTRKNTRGKSAQTLGSHWAWGGTGRRSGGGTAGVDAWKDFSSGYARHVTRSKRFDWCCLDRCRRR